MAVRALGAARLAAAALAPRASARHHIIIPFSAFWLRSSVVSVLISLIADMGSNGSLRFN